MRHRDAVLLQKPDLLGVHMHAMRGDGARTENAQIHQAVDDLLFKLVPTVFGFLARFQNVDL